MSRIVVPVPLVLAQAAAAFVPPTARRASLWTARPRATCPCAGGPDRAGVTPRTASSSRRGTRHEGLDPEEGDILRIKVNERDEDVTVNVPISLALSVLPDSGGVHHGLPAVWALSGPATQVVDVGAKRRARAGDRLLGDESPVAKVLGFDGGATPAS